MKQTQDLERVKDELQKAISRKDFDFTEVLRLSSQLSKLDPENVRFSTNAGHLNQIGLQLVARQETAVAEIVKNAYDADATKVEVTFSGAQKPGGRLLIRDNGHGMDRGQLIDGFMRLSTAYKVNNPGSPTYKRQRAGQKGIGRFSAQRLGKTLRLITQTKGDSSALEVSFKWDSFNTEDDLSIVPSKISTVPKDQAHGTLLIIDNLRDAWSDSQIERVFRYVEDLLQPYPLMDVVEPAEQGIPDPGFQVDFGKMSGVKRQTIASLDKTFSEYSLATIEGSVDSRGVGSWSAISKRLGESLGPGGKAGEALNGLAPYTCLKEIKFRVHYFVYSSDLFPASQLTRLQDLSKRIGGVRLYRNGFRVLPYGELHSDWLNLDATYRARAILPPFSNNNFFGFVEIRDIAGAQFQETASREGLIQNESYHELVSFLFSCLKAAVLRIAAARGTKQTAGQREWKPEAKAPVQKPVAVREVAAELELLADKLSSVTQAAASNVGTTQEEVKDVAARLLSAAEQLHELGMLRVLASLGLTIGEFTHEIMTRLAALRADLQLCQIGLKHDADRSTAVSRLNGHFRMLESYASYFNTTVSANVKRETKALDVAAEVRRFVTEFTAVIERRGIKFLPPDIVGYDLYCRPMHPSEWASILSNFLTNSIKAIRRAKIAEGRIFIRLYRERNNLIMEFSDNGDGIPVMNRDRVFDAFFTTTNDFKVAGEDTEELIGTGLGLKIVKDIISTSGGEIHVVDPAPHGFTTTMRVILPHASDKQIEASND